LAYTPPLDFETKSQIKIPRAGSGGGWDDDPKLPGM
jgi:hypothetical protein